MPRRACSSQRHDHTGEGKNGIKVCMISTSAADIWSFPMMYKMAKTLIKHGFKVYALCSKSTEKIPNYEVKETIRVGRIFQPRLLKARRKVPKLFPRKLHEILAPLLVIAKILITAVPFALRAIKVRADVYHCFHPCGLVAGAVAKSVLGSRRKLVYVSIDDYAYSTTRSYSNYLKLPVNSVISTAVWKIYRAFELSLVRKFADVVFTLDCVGDVLYRRYRSVSDNVVVIQTVPEANAEIDDDLKEEIISRYRGWRLVAYVGVVNELRGCFNMIKAIEHVRREIPNVKLLLIGSTSDEQFMRKALNFIKHHGLSDHVEFLGVVPYSKLHTYLSVCDVGLCTYLHVAPGAGKRSSKLFLYMRAGLPVVASDLPGLREIVKETNCGILVDPRDVRQIADAIIRLLKDPEYARWLGENGIRAVMSKYNWCEEEQKIITAYELLNRG